MHRVDKNKDRLTCLSESSRVDILIQKGGRSAKVLKKVFRLMKKHWLKR